MFEPIRRRNGVVVEVGNDLGIRLGQAAVAGTAQTRDGFNQVPRTESMRQFPGFRIAFGIVDYENLIRARGQPGDRGKGLLKQRRAVSRANDNGDGQGSFLTAMGMPRIKTNLPRMGKPYLRFDVLAGPFDPAPAETSVRRKGTTSIHYRRY